MEGMVLAGQAVLAWVPALWLLLGAVENLRNPAVNRDLVADVMAMRRMREMYPEVFVVFGRNRVERPAAHRLVFALAVAAELAVTAVLGVGAALLTGAAAGLGDPETARGVAALGAAGFAAVFGAFLVGGQWFHYWCGHEGSQATHFALTVWGAVTFVAMV